MTIRKVPKLKDNKKFLERMAITKKYVTSNSNGYKSFLKELNNEKIKTDS